MTTTKTPPAAAKAGKAAKADAVCVAAVDLARAAAEELEGAAMVGSYLGHEVEDERVVTHNFACLLPAYGSWRWAITVARASRAKEATVSETLLLPGAESIIPPPWVPWNERLRPGDLGPGDLLPTAADDVRLLPAYTGDDELGPDDVDLLGPIGWEIGIGRERILSRIGRDDAADRWYYGEGGPEAAIAQSAPARCSSCGFLVRMGGSFAQAFGVCSNEFSPTDGRVVSLDHGCGGHSEIAVTAALPTAASPIIDEVGYDVLTVHTTDQNDSSVEASSPAEPLGHS